MDTKKRFKNLSWNYNVCMYLLVFMTPISVGEARTPFLIGLATLEVT